LNLEFEIEIEFIIKNVILDSDGGDSPALVPVPAIAFVVKELFVDVNSESIFTNNLKN